MDGAAWATWFAAVVALLAAIVASVQAGRANSAARRSAAADERAAAAAERANELAEAAAAKYEPLWDITSLDGDAWAATNLTGEPAFAVVVEPIDPRCYFSDTDDWSSRRDDLEAGESTKFIARRGMYGGDDRFLVSWSRTPDGERLSRRLPLPPRT
jgi:type II secretory pathway pseudopilin PulG